MQNGVYSVQGIPCLYGYDYKDGKRRYFVKTQVHNTILTRNLPVRPGISKKRLKVVAAKAVADLKNGQMNTKPMQTWIEEYIVSHQLGAKTARAYRRILMSYTFNAAENAMRLAQSLSTGVNATQIARTVKAFFHWLNENGVTIANPAANIKVPSVGIRRRTLTQAEIRTFYQKLSESSLELQLYGRLLLETGARVGTIYDITMNDLSKDGLQLRNMKCKRDYSLAIPISNATRKLWSDYIQTLHCETGRIFVTKFTVLNARLRRILNDNFNKDATQERIVIHSLRHTAATIALQNGVPLEIVSRMLDHISINTTYSIYAKPSQKQLNSGFSQLHKALEK